MGSVRLGSGSARGSGADGYARPAPRSSPESDAVAGPGDVGAAPRPTRATEGSPRTPDGSLAKISGAGRPGGLGVSCQSAGRGSGRPLDDPRTISSHVARSTTTWSSSAGTAPVVGIGSAVSSRRPHATPEIPAKTIRTCQRGNRPSLPTVTTGCMARTPTPRKAPHIMRSGRVCANRPETSPGRSRASREPGTPESRS